MTEFQNVIEKQGLDDKGNSRFSQNKLKIKTLLSTNEKFTPLALIMLSTTMQRNNMWSKLKFELE